MGWEAISGLLETDLSKMATAKYLRGAPDLFMSGYADGLRGDAVWGGPDPQGAEPVAAGARCAALKPPASSCARSVSAASGRNSAPAAVNACE